jgi:hypothetical protein
MAAAICTKRLAEVTSLSLRDISIDRDPSEPALAAIEIDAVGTAEILGHELAGLIMKHPEVPRGDVGIIEDDVVVIAAADAELGRIDPEARGDVAMAGKDLDPDHLTTCRASRKRWPSLTASS